MHLSLIIIIIQIIIIKEIQQILSNLKNSQYLCFFCHIEVAIF